MVNPACAHALFFTLNGRIRLVHCLVLTSINQTVGEDHVICGVDSPLAAGFIGSRLVTRRGEGIFPDILLGLVGAVAEVGRSDLPV
jgi:hypothetical protein